MFFKLRSSNNKPLKTDNQRSWRFWREPLIHFFILGLSIFGLHAAVDRKPEATVHDPYLVEVSSADIEWMRTIFNKRMGRGPTVQDLRDQVNHLIREQILSREAVAMGLDEGDIVVRRRLAQKMEFLFKDLSAMTEPTEDDLRTYFFENRRKYETSPRMTFTQVYFSIDSRGVASHGPQCSPAHAREVSSPGQLEPGPTSPSAQQEIGRRFGTDSATSR